jgi:hypothetical protein
MWFIVNQLAEMEIVMTQWGHVYLRWYKYNSSNIFSISSIGSEGKIVLELQLPFHPQITPSDVRQKLPKLLNLISFQ